MFSEKRSRMTTQEVLFSFNGRIGCLTFFKYWLLLLVAWIVGIIVAIFAFPDANANVVFSTLALLVLWPYLAIYFKRLQDRNRSIEFGLLILIPIVGLWALVEVFALKGTDGPNSYGPPP